MESECVAGVSIQFGYPFPHSLILCSGMPTVDGLRKALNRVDAGPEGSNYVFWTSLREVNLPDGFKGYISKDFRNLLYMFLDVHTSSGSLTSL